MIAECQEERSNEVNQRDMIQCRCIRLYKFIDKRCQLKKYLPFNREPLKFVCTDRDGCCNALM